MIDEVVIFWCAVILVLLLSFGHTAYTKVKALNAKHHILEIDDDSVYVYEDDEDDEW